MYVYNKEIVIERNVVGVRYLQIRFDFMVRRSIRGGLPRDLRNNFLFPRWYLVVCFLSDREMEKYRKWCDGRANFDIAFHENSKIRYKRKESLTLNFKVDSAATFIDKSPPITLFWSGHLFFIHTVHYTDPFKECNAVIGS